MKIDRATLPTDEITSSDGDTDEEFDPFPPAASVLNESPSVSLKSPPKAYHYTMPISPPLNPMKLDSNFFPSASKILQSQKLPPSTKNRRHARKLSSGNGSVAGDHSQNLMFSPNGNDGSDHKILGKISPNRNANVIELENVDYDDANELKRSESDEAALRQHLSGNFKRYIRDRFYLKFTFYLCAFSGKIIL